MSWHNNWRFANTHLHGGQPVRQSNKALFLFLVRTFVAEFKIKKTLLNATVELHEVENKITRTVSVLKSISVILFPTIELFGFCV